MIFYKNNLKRQEQKFFITWLLMRPQYWWKHLGLIRTKHQQYLFEKKRLAGESTIRYYPGEVKSAVLKIDLPLIIDGDWYDSLPYSGWMSGDCLSLFKWPLPLAQSFCSISKSFDGWSNLWADDEDTFALNRFIWLLRWLTLHPNVEDVREAFSVIKRWISEMQDRKDHPAWSAYTVSERIINWLIFLCCTKRHLGLKYEDIEFVKQSLSDHIAYLISNLEYSPECKVSNHILNNARALYVGGRLMKLPQVSHLGEVLFRTHTSQLVGSNGFLLEGSSHYQLLLTRTYTEILLFAHLTEHGAFESWVDAWCKKMQRACLFFCPGKEVSMQYFQRIGDCSPDVPVEWFFPKLGIMNERECSWAKLWSQRPELKDCLLEEDAEFGSSKYSSDGWVRVTNKEWVMISHRPLFETGYPANHGHMDFGSFVLFHEGVPVFVDRGRYSYELPVYWDYGYSALAHNTATVEDTPVVPIAKGLLSEYGKQIFDKSSMRISENESGRGISWESAGFERVVPNVHWKREISCRNDRFQITDCFTGRCRLAKKAKIKIRFHLDTKAVLLNHDENMLLFSIEGKKFSFQIFLEENQKKVLHKSISCMDDEHYPAYGKRVPAKTIETIMLLSGDCKVLSVVVKI